MSARFARNAFTAATRRAHSSAANRVSRRAMSSTSHGAQVKSSDNPWIVGSLLVFGPAFLYLVSPSARKNPASHIHDDKHNLKMHEVEAADPLKKDVEIMTDSDGTPSDVGASIAIAEESDVPNDSTSPQAHEIEFQEAEQASVGTTSPEPISEESTESTQKYGSFQEDGEKGPTDLSKAQAAAQSGTAPKQAADAKN